MVFPSLPFELVLHIIMAFELNYCNIQEWTWAFNTLPRICKATGSQLPRFVLRMADSLSSRRIARTLWKRTRADHADDEDETIWQPLWEVLRTDDADDADEAISRAHWKRMRKHHANRADATDAADERISRALWKVAMELDDLDSIKSLLEYQKYTMTRLEPLLTTACTDGKLEIVKLLLNAPYNAPRADSRFASYRDGGDALHIAIARDHLHVVKYLVAFPQNAPSIEDHRQAIVSASFYGRIVILKFFLEYPHTTPHVVSTLAKAVDRALFHAVWNGHINVVRILLDYLGTPPGESLDLTFVAIERQHHNIVELLME